MLPCKVTIYNKTSTPLTLVSSFQIISTSVDQPTFVSSLLLGEDRGLVQERWLKFRLKEDYTKVLWIDNEFEVKVQNYIKLGIFRSI